MNLNDILTHLHLGTATAVAVILLTIIEISPLKINPWDAIFAWLGRKLNGRALDDLTHKVEDLWVNNHRQHILTFARECRNGVDHSSDEWANVLTVAEEYSLFCQKNSIANGVVAADALYLRNLYQELCREHKL